MALLIAAATGRLDIAEFLVKNGAPVNDEEGESKALYEACKNDHEEVVEFLLKNKANVNSEGCLAVSLELYNWNIFLKLIDYGAAAAWVSGVVQAPIKTLLYCQALSLSKAKELTL